MLRGGGWNNTPDNARSAIRNRNTPDNRNNNTGFRLARTLHARASAFKEPDVGSGRVQGQGYKRKESARLDRNCGGGRFFGRGLMIGRCSGMLRAFAPRTKYGRPLFPRSFQCMP